MFEKVTVIDGKDHLVGRLAAVVAKQLLNGQHVVVVRCESLIKSGNFYFLLPLKSLFFQVLCSEIN